MSENPNNPVQKGGVIRNLLNMVMSVFCQPQIRSQIARGILAALVLGGFLISVAIAAVVYWFGGMRFANFSACVQLLLDIYVPVLVLIVAFFTGTARAPVPAQTDRIGFLAMLFVVFFGLILIPWGCICFLTVPHLKELLTHFNSIYSSLILGVVGFFFGREKSG